jgi:RNA polymerase sigma factor (sigma-70 family)
MEGPLMMQAPFAVDDRVGALFTALTPRQFEVLMLRMDGLTQAEIADRLGIKQPAVCLNLKRVREKAKRVWRRM